MLIRSQIQDLSWKGSETRVNDLFSKSYFKKLNNCSDKNQSEKLIYLKICFKRVMKLHERLEKIRLDLSA